VTPDPSFFFFGSTEVWTQDFMLARQALWCLSSTSSPFFALFILELGFHFLSSLA
jgi:hypothetical protein